MKYRLPSVCRKLSIISALIEYDILAGSTAEQSVDVAWALQHFKAAESSAQYRFTICQLSRPNTHQISEENNMDKCSCNGRSYPAFVPFKQIGHI